MNYFEELEQAGQVIEYHESDMYILKTIKAVEIIQKAGLSFNFFHSDGHTWIEVPFGYLPFWTKRGFVKQQ